jgi:tRNA (mo5U34)-methyltransferase
MSTRSWKSRGFGLTVTVPDSIARPLRLLLAVGRRVPAASDQGHAPQQPGPAEDATTPLDGPGEHGTTSLVGAGAQRLRFRPVPELSAAKRDPRTALGFLSDFEQQSASVRNDSGNHPRTEHGSGTSTGTSLAETVAALPWYHTIEMPGGVVSHGMFDHRPLVPHYGIPQTLENLSCLDIACSNGFWAFEFERRGGRVTAVDIASWSDWDLPTGASVPYASAESAPESGQAASPPFAGDPFVIAREALGSDVKRVQRNLYELDPDELGTFDFVHAGDVLLHLERPLEALRRFRSVTADGGLALIADSFDPNLSEPTLTHYFGGFENQLWWMPSLDCLVQMVYDAGFSEVEVATIYNLPAWDLPEGYWRAVLRARP